MNLFRTGDFALSSGRRSNWKIDCEALTAWDWKTLALMLAERLPAFGKVEGVPRGGLLLAAAMEAYATSGESRLLVVDDVLTSGASMEKVRAGRHAVGAVVFARGSCPWWVMPLFQMPGVIL